MKGERGRTAPHLSPGWLPVILLFTFHLSLFTLFPRRPLAAQFPEDSAAYADSVAADTVDQTARFLNGLALQKYPPTGDRSLPVIKIAQLRSGRADGRDRTSADLDPDYIVADGDILFSWSGSLECVLWAGGPGALNQHLFKVTPSNFPRWLCYFAVHHHLRGFRHIAAGKATTRLRWCGSVSFMSKARGRS